MNEQEAIAAVVNACLRGKKYANPGALARFVNKNSGKELLEGMVVAVVRRLRDRNQLAQDDPIRHISTPKK